VAGAEAAKQVQVLVAGHKAFVCLGTGAISWWGLVSAHSAQMAVDG
jgi:hypothetical protein